MKIFLLILLSISCFASALEDNPIAPPKVEVSDKFGANLQIGALSKNLNTVSIGGELGLSHHVQLYTDLFADGNFYGYVDAFAGSVNPKKISENIISIINNANGDPILFRDSGEFEHDHTKRVSVMRPYGPAGSQDFLVYKNGILSRDASAAIGSSDMVGVTFKPVGDTRHTLVLSSDKNYLIWTTPDGIESKYGNTNRRLMETTYPNGYKVRVASRGVTTNTGFMLKYQLNTQGLNGTPDQIVAINLANQYCSPDATTCGTNGWPTATFTWPVGTPSNFWTPGMPSSNYLVKLTTAAGVTEIQYQPEDVCKLDNGTVHSSCSVTKVSGLARWSPRIKSIKTPESTTPNFQYTHRNNGSLVNQPSGSGSFWFIETRVGELNSATLNDTDQQFYGGPTVSPGIITRHSSNNGVVDITVESAQYDLNVINSVTTRKGGHYVYYKDLRNFVEFYTPIKGRGPKQHYYYSGPRGNLNKIAAVSASGSETPLQEVLEFVSNSNACIHPKTCNKPKRIRDARGNITDYEYDPDGRFGSPIKITAPADKNGKRAATIYNYEPKYAYYKRNGEAIAQDPDPVWMLTSEHTCRNSEATNTGCASGNLDMVKTSYYYGPQSTAQANNLLLRGKSIVAEGSSGALETRVWCYEYDKYGKLIGETLPKGNSATLESCQ